MIWAYLAITVVNIAMTGTIVYYEHRRQRLAEKLLKDLREKKAARQVVEAARDYAAIDGNESLYVAIDAYDRAIEEL